MYTVNNSDWDHFVKVQVKTWSRYFTAWVTHGNHTPLHVVRFVREGQRLYAAVARINTWPWGVPLYTEVSSFQGVDSMHCIQRCPHSRVLE